MTETGMSGTGATAQRGLRPGSGLTEPGYRSPATNQGQLFWRRFRRHRPALAGTAVLIVLIALAVLAPVIAGHDPNQIDLRSREAPPSPAHWLGTDASGRDVLARLLYGGRVSMSVGLVSVAISGSIGVVLGALAGYFGRRIDQVIMRVTDTFMCFPTMIIMLVAAAILGYSVFNSMLAIGLFGWTGLCRLVRAEFLRLRASDYVLAAQSVGVPSRRIIFRHMLPNATGPIVVSLTFGVAGGILREAGLSFLGMGVQIPTPSWGNMLQNAQSITVLKTQPWLWMPPALMMAVAVLSINYAGEGLRDALDPRMAQK